MTDPILFSRFDFTLFHSVETLSQKLGVTRNLIRRAVVKELVDNALDAGGNVALATLDDYTVSVADDGPGMPGSDAEIASLFSTGRPLVSSKLLRLPTRGALGNGLRAVAGAVYASKGTLTVITRGRRLTLAPQADGTTSVEESVPVETSIGTTVFVSFGSALPYDPNVLRLGRIALNNCGGVVYSGRSSPHWYDADSWHALMQAAPADLMARAFIADLEGCSGAKAGQIAQPYKNRTCVSLTRDEATDLLKRAQTIARPVKAERLGFIGPFLNGGGYAKTTGTHRVGGHAPLAELPFTAEVWAEPLPTGREDRVTVLVNRTPILAEVQCWRERGKLAIQGAGLYHDFSLPGRAGFALEIAITTPWMPITSDGKEPDLSRFAGPLTPLLKKAAVQAKKGLPAKAAGAQDTHKAVVLDVLEAAIAAVSKGGTLRYAPRHLYYVIRPKVAEAGLGELTYKNFADIITGYEKEIGHDLPGISRDPRGHYILPHTDEMVPLGTLAVERYKRTAWLYGALIYIEKEGFGPVLQDAQWGNRNDCVIMSSKGQSTRAVKDFIDLHSGHDEPIVVLCAHDADAAGTLIYQALVEETKARGRRQVEVINIGLEPWEAEEMGLPVETLEPLKDGRTVAQYVLDYDAEHGTDWAEWLQTHRVELDTMPPEDFIAWLDRKVAPFIRKVQPPAAFAAAELETVLAETVREAVHARILREQNAERQVAEALAAIKRPTPKTLQQKLSPWLARHREKPWRSYIAELAETLATR